MRRIPRADAVIIVLVSGVTVLADLAVAVFVGVIASALVFAWQKSQHISVQTHVSDAGAKVYRLNGPLFFGSIASFRDLFSPADDPECVVVDFSESRVYGHAALDAIDRLAERYAKLGKRVQIVRLSQDCRALLARAGDLVSVDILDDAHYRMAVDELG